MEHPKDAKTLCRTLTHALYHANDDKLLRFAEAMGGLDIEGTWEEILSEVSRMGYSVAMARISLRNWAKFVMAEGLYETLREEDYHEDLDQGLLRIHGGLSKAGHDVLDICNKHLNWAARTYTIENPDHAIDHVMRHLDDYQQESSFAEVSVALDCLDPTKMSAEAIAAALCWTGGGHPEYTAARRRFVVRVLDAGFEELLKSCGIAEPPEDEQT